MTDREVAPRRPENGRRAPLLRDAEIGMNPKATPPWLFAVVTAVVLTAAGAPATALDGYEDRKRLFGAVGVGGGAGALRIVRGGADSLDSRRLQPGFHATAMLGGGITQRVLAAAEANWWFRNVNRGDDHRWATHQWSLLPVVNVFVVEGLHLDAGGGLAYGALVGDHPRADLPHRELGFAAEAGAGYEFWLNGTLAAGVDVNYARHFYGDGSFDTVSGAFMLRWY